MTAPEAKPIIRAIDANLNRASEGLRVVEDLLRFSLSNGRLSAIARGLRHAIRRTAGKMAGRLELLGARDSRSDPGAGRWASGQARRDIAGVLSANMRRAEESMRVLEECARMRGRSTVVRTLQGIRYRLYELERGALSTAARRRG